MPFGPRVLFTKSPIAIAPINEDCKITIHRIRHNRIIILTMKTSGGGGVSSGVIIKSYY